MIHDPSLCRNDNPRVRKRCIDLRRVQADEQLKVIVLSPWIEGFDTHWKGGRTQPCTANKGDCLLCEEHAVYKWIGFLFVTEVVSKKLFFLEMTDHCWDDAKKEKADLPSFRGTQFLFFRKNGKMNSAVIPRLLSNEIWDNSRLPMSKSVVESLRTAWKDFFPN